MLGNEKNAEILTVLHAKGLILYPTDTIWGLGCDATSPEAVEKVSRLKGRPADKGYVILVDSLEMLKSYVEAVHPRIETLLGYHTRPLTVIYDKPKGIAFNALAPDGSVGIRVVQDPFCQALIAQFGKPIVSTSANISGEPFPKHFGEISSDVLEGVDFVVKYRQEVKDFGEPSTIVRLGADEELEFLRQ